VTKMPWIKPSERMKKAVGRDDLGTIHFTPMYTHLHDMRDEGKTAEEIATIIEDELIRVLIAHENGETKPYIEDLDDDCPKCSGFFGDSKLKDHLPDCECNDDVDVSTPEWFKREEDYIFGQMEKALDAFKSES